MALGVGILAIGIIIGQVVTPNIEAQSSGVFGEVVCTGLTVVNHAGEPMIGADGVHLNRRNNYERTSHTATGTGTGYQHRDEGTDTVLDSR